MESIFTNPYKYRESSERNELENYLTELYAGILRKDVGLLKNLLDRIGCKYDSFIDIVIRTQVSHVIDGKTFRPDIQIEVENKSLILVENKVDSYERHNQLKDYCKILNSDSTFENKHLVYISKFHEFKQVNENNIKFNELQWKDIAIMCKQNSLLAKELELFISEKQINMSGNFTYLDALVVESIGDVFEKLDHVLNSAHEYHKKPEGLNIRLDRGRSIGSIKKHGYYILGVSGNIEFVIGFFNSPVELIYRLQGENIPQEIRDGLKAKNWTETFGNGQIQLDKSQKLSKFMTQDGEEVYLMIEFLRSGIDEIKEILKK